MRIYANQLNAELNQRLCPFYMVLGEEPYQLSEAVKQIKHAAAKQGFAEVIRFSVTPQFDWQELRSEYLAMSLFSSQKIIELDLAEQKLPEAGASALKALAEMPNPDVILLLKGEKNSQDVQKTAWFKALDKQGLFIPVYELQGRHLENWLNQYCQQLNLKLSPGAKALLLEANQGNLFAIVQELEKLSLIFKQQLIEHKDLVPVLLNQAKFNVFDLSDALLQGDQNAVCQIVHKLQQENIEPTIVAWSITKEANQLLAMVKARLQGMPINQVMQQFKVWKNKQTITQNALGRLNQQRLETIITALADFDAYFKQHTLNAPYQVLLHICLLFCTNVPYSLPIKGTQ